MATKGMVTVKGEQRATIGGHLNGPGKLVGTREFNW